MMRRIVFATLTLFNSLLNGQTTPTYSFANVTTSTGKTDPGPVPVVKGLLFGDFSAKTIALNPNASGRFSFSNWPVGAADADDNFANYTAAPSPTTYYEVGIAILPGYTLTINSISFNVRRSGTGVRMFSLRSSSDNYNNNLSATTGTNTKLMVVPDNIFFWKYDSISTASDQRGCRIVADTLLKGVTDTVAFRFYAWNAESSGGTFSVDNVGFEMLIADSSMVNPVSARFHERTKLFLLENHLADGFYRIKGTQCSGSWILTDLHGKTVTGNDFSYGTEIVIAIVDLIPGVYTLRVLSAGAIVYSKLLMVR
jgi:hypothetical protein